jgi:hypothetical protein
MKRTFIFLLFSILMSARAYSGAFEPTARWDQNEVRVCWLDFAEFKKNEVLLDDSLYFKESSLFHSNSIESSIQSLIQSEFTPEKTGVYFTGFQKCRTQAPGGRPDADAILALEQVDSFDEIIEGGASIGMSIVDLFLGQIVRRDPAEDEGMPSLVIQVPFESIFHSKTLGYEESIRLTALHEFGHLAGLHHEHAAYRGEALQDPYCLSSPYAEDLKKGLDQSLALVPKNYTENLFDLKGAIRSGYDSRSIMSYCHTRQIVARGGAFSLSPGDRTILKSMYSN